MLPEINTILEVFERMSLDEKVYLTFTNEEDMQVCVLYLKKQDQRNWSFWLALNEQASRQTISIAHLRPVLKAFKVSEDIFIKELASVLLLQASFADEFIRQISELLGKEAVQKSILHTQEFMDELSSKIKEVFSGQISQEQVKSNKEKNKFTLKIIK